MNILISALVQMHFDGPISYGPLERIWNFKKQIKEIDPNWLLADEITLLEHQVLNQIDVIDINVPWSSARNKLRYIDLHQTVVDVFTVMHLRLKTLFGFCHHVETFDSEI